MDWLRWWHGTVTDPKFQRVARMAGASTGEVIAVWACLLERASSVTAGDAPVTSRGDAETRGSVAGFDCDDHDVLLGFEDGTTAKIFAALEDRGLLMEGRIARWEERQPVRVDSSKERTRAWRERKKAQQDAPAVTPGDGHVTKGDALDTDTEGDKKEPPFVPPEGGKASKPKAKPERSKPKRVLPDPFLVSTELLQWAKERVPLVNTDLETERFVNYWKAEGKAKADWPATWRNWMLKVQGDMEKRSPASAVRPAGAHGGFNERDYEKGIGNDGRF
ncbi:hypothetical protein ACM74F_05490 [Pseudomonas aeruginosa]|uniref:hypothetical protein n=1 Tax=Pseudomonas aeruginosa TaxID=287 RepID=UPI0021E13F4D|nr:hypothetical protein [Pseudomonas aeruginosa]MCO3228757.1 hypothetical protein [Pseudomonas aeruginosa]MCV0166699.1 hypothetical protein [Pseudomonas aeruginosa]MDG3721541.1 hypothetical protein [Pseudomonas aeruginosa]MDG3747573.1 hypothetical protein [Pseudomonas aeruginosa]MDG3791641.1 hypothetical protein [Pseudomonas aeruginosa]